MFLLNFFKDAWNKAINPFIGLAWHVIGGAVTGSILPTVTNLLLTGQLTKASAVSTVVSGVIGAIVGYAQHSNNQAVAGLAGQVTPTVQNQIDAKVTAAVLKATTPQPTKITGFILAFFLMAGLASAGTSPFGTLPADGAEVQGLELNLNFAGPAEFVQTVGNGYKLMPTAGLSLSWGFEDVWATPSGTGTMVENQWGFGLCFQANYGNQANSSNTISNAVLGFQATFQGISAVGGLQVMGDPLGGPGSSGVVFGAMYDAGSLINFDGLFVKTSK